MTQDNSFGMLMNILASEGFRVFVIDNDGDHEVVPAQMALPFASSTSSTTDEAAQIPAEDNGEEDEEEVDGDSSTDVEHDDDDDEYMGAKAWQD